MEIKRYAAKLQGKEEIYIKQAHIFYHGAELTKTVLFSQGELKFTRPASKMPFSFDHERLPQP
jgi:hypothetical protein